MKIKTLAVAGALAFAFAATPAAAKTFRYAFQGDLNALDPYTLNETLHARAPSAMSWRASPSATRTSRSSRAWPSGGRSSIRSSGGSTCARASSSTTARTSPPTTSSSPSSACAAPAPRSRRARPADMKAVKVDDYTVDFVLTSPNPILHAEWDTWYMFSKKWSEANGATQAQSATATSLNPFALKANGTGPFTDRQPRARREDGVQAEPQLVGQARAQPRRGRSSRPSSRTPRASRRCCPATST